MIPLRLPKYVEHFQVTMTSSPEFVKWVINHRQFRRQKDWFVTQFFSIVKGPQNPPNNMIQEKELVEILLPKVMLDRKRCFEIMPIIDAIISKPYFCDLEASRFFFQFFIDAPPCELINYLNLISASFACQVFLSKDNSEGMVPPLRHWRFFLNNISRPSVALTFNIFRTSYYKFQDVSFVYNNAMLRESLIRFLDQIVEKCLEEGTTELLSFLLDQHTVLVAMSYLVPKLALLFLSKGQHAMLRRITDYKQKLGQTNEVVSEVVSEVATVMYNRKSNGVSSNEPSAPPALISNKEEGQD